MWDADVIEQEPELDIPSLIRGRAVALVGNPATMTTQEFRDLLEANGAKPARLVGRGVPLVVVGQKSWPVNRDGLLLQGLRLARRYIREHSGMKVVSEEQFLTALGLPEYRQSAERLYTISTLTQVLGVSADRVRAWVATGLIRPCKVEYGVWWFDFRQVSAGKTLWELVQSGVPMKRLRLSLEQLRKWIPQTQEPLEQLAVIEGKRQLLIRLEQGELLEPDGQLHFEFPSDDEAGSLKIMPGPRTAADWAEQGIEQEQQGYVAEAAESYRKALLLGGPDARICFNLANVLNGQGKKAQAIERYFQAVEIDPTFGDAWNNLGLALADTGRKDDACAAFRKALAADRDDAGAHFNLADLLEELRRYDDAAEHWRQYARLDPTSQWGRHARSRLG
jgi:tetratricopeptide (TPR) repeat protein